MRKFRRFLFFLLLIIAMAYYFGPRPPKPVLTNDLPVISVTINNAESTIEEHERRIRLKPDNEARILWANDSIRERTEYCLLYLHGFSASWYEGFPANIKFAKRYGCNAYFSRLYSHGIDTSEALIDMTPDKLWESAKEALMIAKSLGRKIILMSSSTGGTLSVKLAAEFPEYVHSLIMYSPNVRINNNMAFLLSGPWGLQIARKISKGKYRITKEDTGSKECRYWDCRYRVEAIVYLQQLLDATMNNKTFRKVTAPVFLGYYYRDDENQDKTVKVSAMLDMYDHLGTPPGDRQKQAFPDAGAHVIACEITSKSVDEVVNATFHFAENVLGLKPAE